MKTNRHDHVVINFHIPVKWQQIYIKHCSQAMTLTCKSNEKQTIFTSHISGRGTIFNRVRGSMCVSACVFVCLHSVGWTVGPADLKFQFHSFTPLGECKVKVMVSSQGQKCNMSIFNLLSRIKVKVSWFSTPSTSSLREVRHSSPFHLKYYLSLSHAYETCYANNNSN